MIHAHPETSLRRTHFARHAQPHVARIQCDPGHGADGQRRKHFQVAPATGDIGNLSANIGGIVVEIFLRFHATRVTVRRWDDFKAATIFDLGGD
jgi:hypothetical protein